MTNYTKIALSGANAMSLVWQRNLTPILANRAIFAAILLIFFGTLRSAAAQEPIRDETVPPPARVLSKQEKAQLEKETEVKKRTKLSLQLMAARVTRSEELSSRNEWDAMFVELGGFHALVDNTLEFLNESDDDSSKVLYNYKRFEIGLRALIPRLEVIRRELPLKYDFYVRRLVIYLRDARTKAVEPMFSDTVLPTQKP